jgi:hypothetical protein
MTNVKRRNHYIPKFYLKGFCDDKGRIWIYEKENPGNPIASSPNSTAVIKKLYHIENHTKGLDELENYFADSIEGPASRTFKGLLAKKIPHNGDREQLALFFGTLMTRTPSYISHLQQQQNNDLLKTIVATAEDKNNFNEAYREVHKDLSDEEIERDRKFILDKEYSLTLHRDIILNMMLYLGAQCAIHLMKMKWALIETDEKNPFILSDNFMHLYHPSVEQGYFGFGLGMKGICVHIPISNLLSLMLVNDSNFADGLIFNVNDPPLTKNGDPINLELLIKSLNNAVYIKSNKYVFANSNLEAINFIKLLEEAKKIEESK